MHVSVLVVEPCPQRWAQLRNAMAARGISGMAVGSAREAAMVLDAATVSVLVMRAVGSTPDHRDVLLRLGSNTGDYRGTHVVLLTDSYSSDIVAAYGVLGSSVTLAQTDPCDAILRSGALHSPHAA